MRVIVDVMGGDKAPLETVKGAAEAAKELHNVGFTLVGDRNEIERVAAENGLDLHGFEIVHTPVTLTMEDDPLSVVRAKKDSSMSVALHLLADGKGDALVSTGNTGALFTGATLIVRKIRGVLRPAIGSVLPTARPCILLDTGANVTVTEEYLEQFAVMGSAYMRHVFNMEAPTVGLLNNGTEEHKGTPLHVAANKRLRACESIHYIGNVEADAVPFSACNVVVTDGFTGNVFVKTMEGMGRLALKSLKEIFLKNLVSRLSAILIRSSVDEVNRKFNPSEYGGSPFLGISKAVVKAHGSSDAEAFKNAIRVAVDYAGSGVIYDIAGEIERFNARAAEAAETPAEAPDGEGEG